MAGPLRPFPLLTRPLEDQSSAMAAEHTTGETELHHSKHTTDRKHHFRQLKQGHREGHRNGFVNRLPFPNRAARVGPGNQRLLLFGIDKLYLLPPEHLGR